MRMFSIFVLLAATLPQPAPVWRGPGVTLLGGPSKDGKWLSYVDAGNLAVREIVTGRTTLLTHRPKGSKEFAYFSTMSADSRRVAYAWFNELGFYELRVIDMDGGEPRTLYRNEEAGFVQPCAWSTDGSQILTLLFRKDNISQIVMQPAAGGLPKVLKSLNWVYPKKMDISPDGRWIAYDSFASDGGGDRTIYVLAIDGSIERKLISQPGDHLFPVWTPDGTSIVYASGTGAWMLSMADGKPSSEPKALVENLGRIVPLGITREGIYYFGLRTGGTDIYVSDLDLAQLRISGDARPVNVRLPGRNSQAVWSPNGQYLAFLSRRGSETFNEESRVIVLRAAKGNEEREVTPKLARMEAPQWSPNGKLLLVRGSDRQGRNGLYKVDIQTSAITLVYGTEQAELKEIEGAWGADSESIYFFDQSRRLKKMQISDRTIDDVTGEEVCSTGARSLTSSAAGDRVAFFCGSEVRVLSGKSVERYNSTLANASELAWAPAADAVFAGDGTRLVRIALDHSGTKMIEAPKDRSPGFSVNPNGKTVAFTAGSTNSEIWSLKVQ